MIFGFFLDKNGLLVLPHFSSPSDEGLTPTKDGGTCLRRLSMFRKEVH